MFLLFYNIHEENKMRLKTLAVGLGKQALEDHTPAVLASEHFILTAVYDINYELTLSIASRYSVQGLSSLEEAVAVHPDVAIVAVPHDQYVPILRMLSGAGIHIIKEKPFATNMKEAREIHDMVRDRVFLGVILQRRFNPIFQAFPQMRRQIGKIFSIEGRYTMNVLNLSEGWRASHAHAGGGALIDMGYHFIDLLVWYMGMPQTVTARISRGNRLGQEYDVEDTVNLLFDYNIPESYHEKTVGNFLISRVYPQKSEILSVYGTKGVVEVQRGQIRRFNIHGDEEEVLTRREGWPSAMIDQLDNFGRAIIDGERRSWHDYEEHLKHIAIIEAAYDSDRNASSRNPADFLYPEGGYDE